MKRIIFFIFIYCYFEQVYTIPPHVLKKLPQEVVDLIHYFRNGCAPKFGLTDADIEAYEITNTEEKYKCYMKCMLNDAKWMSEDGTIHYERILDEIHSDVKPFLEASFSRCRDIPDSPEPCGKAYNFHACMQKSDPVHYFLP